MPILLGTIGKQTDKAVLFHIKQVKTAENAVPYDSPLRAATWFPLSQVTRMVTKSSITSDDELHVSEWIATQKGLYEELD